jgi:Flp pilus assembly protein TadD
VLEQDPLHILANRGLAQNLSATGQSEAALAQWNRTLEIDLDHAHSHLGLALFHFERGRREEGLRHLQRAGGLEFEGPPALASLAVVHAASGNEHEARRLLEKLESESARRCCRP